MTNPQHEALVEALPCPWCGDTPSMIECGDTEGIYGLAEGHYWIICMGSDGKRQEVNGGLREHKECEVGPECEAPTKAEAIVIWNTRAALSATAATPSDEEVRLRAALERLGSMEAFHISRPISIYSDGELLARIDFARAALEPQAKDAC